MRYDRLLSTIVFLITFFFYIRLIIG